jgi:hypothetical protein
MPDEIEARRCGVSRDSDAPACERKIAKWFRRSPLGQRVLKLRKTLPFLLAITERLIFVALFY